jgi:hypothetical protein
VTKAARTISFRGLDNASYYRLPPESTPLHYENHSGCGNTLDIRRPQVLQLVMDSLRYWVSDMHVDGFRFDLAPVLGRGDHGFDRDGAFFTAWPRTQCCRTVKMIAEPWDIGPGRLPGRRVSARLAGVERQVPRHHARLLAGHGDLGANSPSGCADPATSSSQRGRLARWSRSTMSSRTTVSRCATW